ncbi:M48 family metalloprotease [Bradyrhizobium sp. WSM 1791]|uniref:M48 family metalloprotease n=1 Tax=Bradyrhizobium australiense TaxID=2721161 RepID=A0A7Y4LZ14_9BRAD|nr:M48 family metalloprotease [Bradyrhizobium australiense]
MGADRHRHRRPAVRRADGVARPYRSPQDGFPLRRRSGRAAALSHRRAADNHSRASDPYVAVIDSPALNAFACGIRQKDAVLVFTRGLIDGLDDDELAAVAAHEIVHIVNGDIRLIAATNVCLDTLQLLQPRPSTRGVKRIQAACALPILALLLPLLVVLILVTMFLRRLAVDGSHLTRKLIASAREFIADAEAVRLTQNPAALVSALRRIEGRSVIPGLAAGQDAMVIDGAHEGAFATHPTIAERVAAIISVTGSMAPDRAGPPRHTRAPAKRWRRFRPSTGAVPRGGLFARRAAGCECRARARLPGRIQQARTDAGADGGRGRRHWGVPVDSQRGSRQTLCARRRLRSGANADPFRRGRARHPLPDAGTRLEDWAGGEADRLRPALVRGDARRPSRQG